MVPPRRRRRRNATRTRSRLHPDPGVPFCSEAGQVMPPISDGGGRLWSMSPPELGDHAERRGYPRDPARAGNPLAPAVPWGAFATAQPALAGRVRERFSAHAHLTMATVRAD